MMYNAKRLLHDAEKVATGPCFMTSLADPDLNIGLPGPIIFPQVQLLGPRYY